MLTAILVLLVVAGIVFGAIGIARGWALSVGIILLGVALLIAILAPGGVPRL